MMQKTVEASEGLPSVTVIIPALDEVGALPGLLGDLEGQEGAGPLQVILADGGSRDGTVALFEAGTRNWAARGWAVRALDCPKTGRAAQMNAGAAIARGDLLLFLHADTRLPPQALRAVRASLLDRRVVGGGFRHRFDAGGALLRLISFYATSRSRLRRLHYGDQAMFVRRSRFEALGGFPDIPLFEDLRLALALRRCGTVITLAPPVVTSSRRLRQGGVARTAARFAWLKLRHALGADPRRLRGHYPDVR